MLQLAAVAAIASLIVLTVLSTGLHAKMGDEAAAFIQSIGVTEYAGKESTQEVMNQAAKALDMARSHNGNDYKGLRRAA